MRAPMPPDANADASADANANADCLGRVSDYG